MRSFKMDIPTLVRLYPFLLMPFPIKDTFQCRSAPFTGKRTIIISIKSVKQNLKWHSAMGVWKTTSKKCDEERKFF